MKKKSSIAGFREALQLDRTLSRESCDVAINLNSLADAERRAGDYDAAERDYRESLRIARGLDDHEGIGVCTGNLALLALCRGRGPRA